METLISKKIPRIFTHQNKYSIPGEESNNGSENDANYPTVQRLSKPTPKVITDVIYENQRGFFLLGVPKFSPYLLNPVDPPAWCDKNWRGISTEISLFPLPDPSWEWMDDRWLVDMSGDIDPFGWQYAVRFRGHNWRGHSKPLQSFARRRKWIRRRRRTDQTESSGEVAVDITPAARSSLDIPYGVTSPSPTGMSDNAPDSPLTGPLSSNQYTPMSSMTSLTCEPDQNPSHYPMLIEIKQSRIDREKLQIVQDHLTKGVQLNEFMVEWMMNNLDYETSRKRLLQMIVDYKAQPESGISGYIGIERAIASPPLSPKMLLSPSTQQRLNVSHQYSHSADELRIYGTSNYDTKSRNVSNRNSLTFFSDKKPLFNLENYN